jgi:predicted acylesterase/phospholipase RssA/CRP-like cAMP-binding protein
MELPKPPTFAREVSSDLVLDGVRLNGDSYLAFMAIMNSWKVFGGRDVPLLLKMCTGVTTLTLRAGECLFEEGKPLERCLYILKDGELEISVQPDMGLGQPQPVYSSSGDGATTATPLLPPDFLERIDQKGTIVSGILDFVALLTESSVAEYCASARCTKDCRIVQVPIIPTNGGRRSSSSVGIYSGSDRIRSGSTSSNISNSNGASPSVVEQEEDEPDVPRNSASAQARCRLIRSCLIRSHRVTLATAYAYLGVIYDLYPRHPIFPVVGSALTSLTPEALLGEKHQHALKRLIRLVLALDSDHAIPDLERCTTTASGGNGGSNGVAPGAAADPRPLQRRGSGATSPSGFGGGVGGVKGDASGTTSFPWNQPRLYLLRRGESPHELDEQSRTSLHILVTGRLQVTKVDATAAAPGGTGQAQGQQGHGRASPSGIGKSIFSDHYGAMRGPLAAAMALPPSLSLSSGSPASGAAAAAASAAAAARGEHGPGAVLGYSCLLTGAPEDWYTPRGKNRARLRLEASCDSLVVQIPLAFVEKAMKPHPLATLALAARKTLETIPRVLRVIDFGVKWKQLQAGEVLVREGQPSDGCLYVLLYGRARSSIQHRPSASVSSPPPQAPSDEVEAAKLLQEQEREQKENVVVVADHGRGTLIGETEILTGGTHKVTVQAVRYTSFATIPSSVLSLLIRRHPRVLAHLAEHVVEKAAHNSRHHLHFYRDRTPMKMFTLPMPVPAGAADRRQGAGSPFWASSLAFSSSPGARRVVVGEPGAKTILVLPASNGVPMDYFIKTLEGALVKARHSVRTVTSALAASVLGLDEDTYYSAAWCRDNVLLLESWLTQQEEQHEIVLYQADWEESEWNRMAAGMADVVLLVANAADEPGIADLERKLEPFIRNAQKLLILLHVNPSPYHTPSGTRLWIEKRKGIQQHYHVRMHTQSAQFDQQHIRSDFARLSRILTGTAVGLVLGGGGARGMAHLGLLRVLEEEGIPVDHIVGVSIGAFIGGLYAKHSSYLEILPFASRFAQNMSSTWLFVKDFTLPFTSYFNGYSFGRELEKAFGDTKIEDCWLSFACLTVDLSVSRERVHQNGTLWRYVRASMTLAGLLPPLCDVDPNDDDAVHYLVDGGYVNNLPADVMKEVFSAETTIACDIGVEVRMTGRQDYGDTLTGLQILLHALLPTWVRGGEATTLKAPSMGEISSQLMYVRSVQQLERAKESIDCYLRPPVTHFGIMEWKRHAELQSLGYLYCRDSVRAWREALKKEKGGRGTTSAFRAVMGSAGDQMRKGRSLNSLDDYQSA